MAEVLLPITLAMTAVKTFLVVDAVHSLSRGSSVVARAGQSIRSMTSRAPGRSPIGSPRQVKGPASAGASKARGLHLRLLSMHATSTIAQGAGAAKYLLPVSDSSCAVTHRILLAMVLLNDASLVLFLLAKVHVTNGKRRLACWEKGIIWWSRFYGCIYLPLCAALIGFSFPGSANAERTFCYNGLVDDGSGQTTTSATTNSNARSFGYNNVSLVIQFVLLLVLFVKPMRVRVEGAQSGGAVYRRVVVRNIVCTAGIVVSYAVTTLVVVLALLRESLENNKSAQVRDLGLAANSLATLCLTEIALPLGFTSCMTACSSTETEGGVKKPPPMTAENQRTEGKATAKSGSTTVVVVRPGTTALIPREIPVLPVEDLSPQLP